MGVTGSQFAICICELQKLRVFSSRDGPKVALQATVGINLILMIKRFISDYSILQIPTEYHRFFRVLKVVIRWRNQRF